MLASNASSSRSRQDADSRENTEPNQNVPTSFRTSAPSIGVGGAAPVASSSALASSLLSALAKSNTFTSGWDGGASTRASTGAISATTAGSAGTSLDGVRTISAEGLMVHSRGRGS